MVQSTEFPTFRRCYRLFTQLQSLTSQNIWSSKSNPT